MVLAPDFLPFKNTLSASRCQMTENDLEHRDSNNGVPWFEALCFVSAVTTLLLAGLIVWDLVR